jgi:signal transduction histidine kinase
MSEGASGMATRARPRRRAQSLIARLPVRWIVLSLVSAAIIATTVQSYREIDRELTAAALSRREVVVQLTAATLTEKFGRLVDVAIALATRPRVQDLVAQGKWVEASGFLRSVPRDLPHIERLFLTDVRGTLKVDVPRLPAVRGTNFAFRDWFQGVSRDWRPYISPVYTRAATPRLNVFAVAVPVKSARGGVVGILVLQIRIESLFEWVEALGVSPEEFIYIVDSKGQVAFHSKYRDRQEIVDLSETPVVQRLRRGEHGVETGFDPVEREDSIIAYAAVPEHGWGVVAQQPTRASFGLAARDEQLRRLLTGYGLILLLGTAAVFLTARIAVAHKRAEEDRRMKTELEQRVAERTAQLEAANRELEAFSYSVSHDLRAPLRSIDGFSQVLLEVYAGKLDAQGVDCLQRVRAATQRMGLLIDDLLKLSRVTRAEMNIAPVDLSAMAGTLVEEFRKADPERKVEVAIEPGLKALGDPALLRVMLENLLSNAWKFTGKKDHARIELGSNRDSTGEQTFYVRDNGAGFDMEYVGKLFGAFQRLHNPSEFPGTGIGLATAQRVLHRHGGHIRAEGAIDRGTTFYFALPMGSIEKPTKSEEAAYAK